MYAGDWPRANNQPKGEETKMTTQAENAVSQAKLEDLEDYLVDVLGMEPVVDIVTNENGYLFQDGSSIFIKFDNNSRNPVSASVFAPDDESVKP